MLDFIQRSIRLSIKLPEITFLIWYKDNSHRCRDPYRLISLLICEIQLFQKTGRISVDYLFRNVLQEHKELVTAKTADNIILSEMLLQDPCNVLKSRISCLMSQSVIQSLKVIQVKNQTDMCPSFCRSWFFQAGFYEL